MLAGLRAGRAWLVAQPLQPDEGKAIDRHLREYDRLSDDLRVAERSSRARGGARRARQAQSKAAHDLPGDRDTSLNTPPQPKPWVRFGLSGPQMRLRAYWAGRGIIGQPETRPTCPTRGRVLVINS